MRDADVLHLAHTNDCTAIAPCGFAVRLRTVRGLCRRVTLEYTVNKYDWGHRERAEMRLWLSSTEYDWYTVNVSGNDCRFAYVFEMEDKQGETWFLSEEGVSRTYDFSLAYYSFFQYPYVFDCDLHRRVAWADGAVMYQIFPDRFRNGMGEKPDVTAQWEDAPTPRAVYGGDLVGVREQLPYLRDLGVTCLYLTPVHPSPSNHKYDIVDYFGVDERFGGLPALQSLVDSAHEMGVRVLLDGVFNHCSDQSEMFQDVLVRGKASPYHDWFFIDGDRPDPQRRNYRMFGDVGFMPKLNTGNPAVIDYFCRVGRFWIEQYHVDGWRLDVSDELSDDFLRAFRKAVKSVNPDAIIIGEVWHGGDHWLHGDMFDGVMNYALTKACIDGFASRTLDAEALRDRLCNLLVRGNDTVNRMMLNLLDSHDTPRFLTVCGEDEDSWKQAFALVFFWLGIPCVLYGDEAGLTGGGDPDCRKGFPWTHPNGEMQAFIRRMATLRAQPALQTGDIAVTAANGVLCIERRAPEQTLRLFLNLTDEPRSLREPTGMTTIPAHGLEIR